MSEPLTLNIGLCGFGTVGQGVWKHLSANRAELEGRLGVKLNLARAAVRDLKKKRDVKIPTRALGDDPLSIANDPSIHIVCELMGGTTTAREVGGVLSDHYDPRSKKVRLSQPNYEGRSLASIAVAAHEVGHVLQHHQGYAPLAIRSAIVPVAGLGSALAFPLFFIGFLFGGHGALGRTLMDVGILFFAGAVLFQAVTLPVEFDASRRAMVQLTETGALAPEEVAGAKRVLDAAALTYVAAAAMAALQLLRLVLLRRSRD